MKKGSTYLKVICLLLQAIMRYHIKFHPYKITWIIIWGVEGIIQSVRAGEAVLFVIFLAIMLIPFIIKWFALKLDEMDKYWRVKHKLEKERRIEEFKQYVEKYIEMKLNQ